MNASPTEQPGEHRGHEAPNQPSEEELRAAYEEELSRITSADLALQAAVSLLNIGGRRLGLSTAAGEPADGGRDLEQVRDAIDGVRALLVILERRRPDDIRPLRDALSQLQMAYAREATTGAQSRRAGEAEEGGAEAQPSGSSGERAGQPSSSEGGDTQEGPDRRDRPGPAESSGRLWVPGR